MQSTIKQAIKIKSLVHEKNIILLLWNVGNIFSLYRCAAIAGR